MKGSRNQGVKGSSEITCESYQELNVILIIISVCELETQIMISGDLGYMEKERFQEIREDIGDVERMLKVMIKTLENKHLNP